MLLILLMILISLTSCGICYSHFIVAKYLIFRDVTKFEFDDDRTSNVFHQIRNSTNVLSALLSNANLWKNPCSTTDFICTDSQRVQTNQFFSQIQPVTQTTVTYD